MCGRTRRPPAPQHATPAAPRSAPGPFESLRLGPAAAERGAHLRLDRISCGAAAPGYVY